MGVACQSCGAVTDKEARFCPECGGKLDKCCSSCGAIIELDARFCGECGLHVVTEVDPPTQRKRVQQNIGAPHHDQAELPESELENAEHQYGKDPSDMESEPQPDQNETIYFDVEDEASRNEELETDPLYHEAVAHVQKIRKVNITRLQRHFRIGYNRAARMLDQMAREGIITPIGPNGYHEAVETPSGVASFLGRLFGK